jgi:hypothetical protein
MSFLRKGESRKVFPGLTQILAFARMIMPWGDKGSKDDKKEALFQHRKAGVRCEVSVGEPLRQRLATGK